MPERAEWFLAYVVCREMNLSHSKIILVVCSIPFYFTTNLFESLQGYLHNRCWTFAVDDSMNIVGLVEKPDMSVTVIIEVNNACVEALDNVDGNVN